MNEDKHQKLIDRINNFFDKIEKGLFVTDKFFDEVLNKVLHPILKLGWIIVIIAIFLGEWNYIFGLILGIISIHVMQLEKEIIALRKVIEDKSKDTPTSLI